MFQSDVTLSCRRFSALGRNKTIGLAFFLGAWAASAVSASAAPQQAKKADDFVDSIGVCLHTQNYDDTQWNTVKSQLGTLGVRYFRDGLELTDNATYKARMQGLYDSYGMKMLAVCGPYGNNALQPTSTGSLSGVVDKVASIKPFLLAVEGPNEPEYFWYDGWNYGGFTDRPSQIVWYQNKLYDSIKADSRTSSVQVTSFATARPETYGNYFSNKPLIKHDAFAWHYYNGRQLPTPYDWIAQGRNYLSSDAATKPAYLTEHGYRVVGDGNVTQKAQMKLDTRSMAFFFNWDNYNNQKVFFYVAGRDTAGGEDYGLDNQDFTPRPVYNSLKNVISYLKEGTWNTSTKAWSKPSFTPGSLDYTVTGDNGDYGYRLVQKSNGDFFLIALPYTQVANNGDGSDITNPPRNATFTFTGTKKVVQYKTDDNGNYTETTLTNGATSVNVGLPDTLTILKISAVGAIVNPAPIGQRIAIKAGANSKYVQNNLGVNSGNLIAEANMINDTWQKFDVIDAGSGLVALRAVNNSKYVSCNINSGGLLQGAFATSIGSWEKFAWTDLSNNNFGLKANINGKYVSSDQNDGSKLKASWANSIGSWETFNWVGGQ